MEDKKWLHQFHFLKIDNGKLIFWDYKNHTQFEMKPDYLDRLIDFSRGSSLQDSEIDKDIDSADIIVSKEPEKKWHWDWLAHIFHYGTCHPLSIEVSEEDKTVKYTKSYYEFCDSISETKPEVELIKGEKTIELPEPDLLKLKEASLWETMEKRRTCRDFRTDAVDLRIVSDLLYATFGEVKYQDPYQPEGFETYGYRRTSPSAGSLQATEPYLWVKNVEGLEPGIYHYQSCRHKLSVVRAELPEEELGVYLCNQFWASDLPFAVFMTSRFDKMWWKYPHSRAYRPMLAEIGHFSQTLNLCMTAYGLNPWLTGYFHDEEINELLQVCSPEEHVLFIVGAGYGSGSCYNRTFRKLAESNQI